MTRLLFQIFSFLPLNVLYGISGFIAFVLEFIAGYRKKIILHNLRNSFPEKTTEEIKKIKHDYYRHISDLLVESVKAFRISKNELKKRVRIVNLPDFNRFADERRSVIVLLGHTSNWEWNGLMLGLTANYDAQAVYRPLRNNGMNKLMLKLRSRFGSTLVSEKNIARNLLSLQLEQTATAFIADQTPSWQHAVRFNFLKQETPFFTGAEKLARKLNLPVLYASTRKLKRGYYLYRFEIISEEPSSTPENFIMQQFAEKLERDINNQPYNWLWSHRRWKQSR